MKLSKKDMKGIGALVGGPDLSKLQKKIATLTAKLPEAEAKKQRRELRARKKKSRSPFPHTMEAQVGSGDWVQDTDKWTQARQLALKDRDADHPAYWSLVTHHYKQSGGRIRAIDAQVGETQGIAPDQLAKGIKVEMEHEDSLQSIMETAISQYEYWEQHKTPENKRDWQLLIDQAAKKIAQDHLREISNYYDRLAVMESKAKQGHSEIGK